MSCNSNVDIFVQITNKTLNNLIIWFLQELIKNFSGEIKPFESSPENVISSAIKSLFDQVSSVPSSNLHPKFHDCDNFYLQTFSFKLKH